MLSVVNEWVPDTLWELVQPLLPSRSSRELGGRPRVDERAVFATVLFVATTSATWRAAETVFGVHRATAHRRFQEWTRSGVWPQVHRAALNRLGEQGLLNWSRAAVDSMHVPAKKGAPTPARAR